MAARVHVAEDEESDEDEALAVAKSSQRGQVAMFTWPTPREYYRDYAQRKKSKILIPSDMTRDALLSRFRKVMQGAGHWPKVTNVLIALEPHQRFRPDGSGREVHYHIAFKLSEDFAHRHIEVLFRLEGIHGFISKSLKGWLAYAEYLLCETPRKPAHCRDASPLLWPRGGPEAVEHLRGLCNTARKRTPTLTEAVTGWKKKAPKRRRTLEWSEVISLVVENEIRDEGTWWQVAKRQQTDQGDTLMINYVDRLRGKQGGLQKAISDAWRHHRAINGDPVPSNTCLHTTAKYALESFILSDEMKEWVREDHKSKALVLEGPGGIGKTQLAMALLLRVRKRVFFIDDYEQVNQCQWTGVEGVLFDDVCMRHKGIDECKALFDMDWSRVVRCRYENGLLPEGTPRIFSTNHTRALFFPRDYNLAEHQHPINRRMLWLRVTRCFRDGKDHEAQIPGASVQAADVSEAFTPEHVSPGPNRTRTKQHEAYSSEDAAKAAPARSAQPRATSLLQAQLPIKTQRLGHPDRPPKTSRAAVPTRSPRLQHHSLTIHQGSHDADTLRLVMQSLATLHRTGLHGHPVRRKIAKKQGPPLPYLLERLFKPRTRDTQPPPW